MQLDCKGVEVAQFRLLHFLLNLNLTNWFSLNWWGVLRILSYLAFNLGSFPKMFHLIPPCIKVGQWVSIASTSTPITPFNLYMSLVLSRDVLLECWSRLTLQYAGGRH